MKTTFWKVLSISAAAGIVCIAAAVCFLTDPAEKSYTQAAEEPFTQTIEETSMQIDEEISLQTTEEPYAEDQKAEMEDSPADNSPASETFDSTDPQSADSPLDKAIYTAIMERNQSVYLPDCDFSCCDFVMLETVSATPLAGNTAHTVICYGWALYQQYNISENGIESRGGGHIPVALTFTLDNSGYTLIEYWEPRGGGDYVSDIQSKFPGNIAEDGIDSQKFIIQQIQSCYSQAIQYSGLDYNAVISHLLTVLCSDVDSSFDPQNNYDRRNTEFRELIYYGEYTLRCFFNRFAQGGENGLEGRIMALICEELLQTRGELPVNAADADTGQLWYDTLLAHGYTGMDMMRNESHE